MKAMTSPIAARRLRYRFPLPVYYFFLSLTFLLLQVAFRSTPTEDLSKLAPTPEVAALLASDAAGHKRSVSAQVVWYQLANLLYQLSVRIGLPFWALQAIGAVTVVIHAGEASYAWLLCRRWRAGAVATCAYVVLTLLGGFGQLLPLKAAVEELEQLSAEKKVKSK